MRNRRAAAVAGALSLVAFGLSLLPAGRESLWQDEGVSAMTASGSWSELWHTLRTFDPNMSLYDVVLRGWQVGGTGVAWQRGLSVVFTGATVFVVYLIATRLRDSSAGVAAAAVFAVSPFAVRYGHELRSYAMLGFLVALTMLLLVRLVDEPSTGTAIACGVVAALSAYAHAYGLLAALALALSLPLLGRSLPPRRVLGTLAVVYAVVLAPFVALVATGPEPLIDWITAPDFGALRGLAATLAGNNVLLVLAVLLLGFLGYETWRSLRTEGRCGATWSRGLPLLGVLVPPVVALAWTYAVQPVVVGRYLIVCLPALAVAMGIAITFLPRSAVQVGVVVVVVLASGASIHKFLDEPNDENWQALVEYVTDHAEPGDGVLFCTAHVRPTYEYYALRTPGALAVEPLSPADPWGDGTHVDRVDAAAVARFDTVPRIWVVQVNAPKNDDPACDLDRSMAGRTATDTPVAGKLRLTRYDS